VGLRTSQDGMERRKILPLMGLEIRRLGHPARSQSLYRLRNKDVDWIYLAQDRVPVADSCEHGNG
jgi:hypothetical protein